MFVIMKLSFEELLKMNISVFFRDSNLRAFAIEISYQDTS